ncbi:MAG: rod shape-determining protein MreC [Calditrichaceae bacterium]
MNITRFIARFFEFLLLSVYMILSLLLMLSSESKIVAGLRQTGLVTIGSVQSLFSSTGSYFDLKEKNRELRKENTQLSYEIFQLQDALLENLRLKELLQFKYEVDYDLIPAKVIGFSPQDFVSGLLLSTKDYTKIKEDAAVMTSDGLVGKIVSHAGKNAICQILMDPNSRVSARIQRSRDLGIILWDGGTLLKLDHIPNTITVFEGDVLTTSGYSKLFPPNIKIGVVIKVEKSEEKLFQSITVKPAVNFNQLEEVFILQAKDTDESGT